MGRERKKITFHTRGGGTWLFVECMKEGWLRALARSNVPTPLNMYALIFFFIPTQRCLVFIILDLKTRKQMVRNEATWPCHKLLSCVLGGRGGAATVSSASIPDLAMFLTMFPKISRFSNFSGNCSEECSGNTEDM